MPDVTLKRLKPGVSGLSLTACVRRCRKALARQPQLVAEIESRIAREFGPDSGVSVTALLCLGGGLAMKKQELLLTEICNATREIDRKEAELLGLIRANGKDITYRQVEGTATRISQAFYRASHNHAYIDEEAGAVVDPDTGEIIADLAFVNRAQAETICQCPANCPVPRSIALIGCELLAGMPASFGFPLPDTVALDSYGLDTHYRNRAYGGLADLNPDYVPDSDPEAKRIAQQVADRNAVPNRNRRARREITPNHHKSAAAQVADWQRNAEPMPRRNRYDRRRPPLGPTAEGTFEKASPGWPQISPDDNRLRPTIDADAATGYRSRTQNHPSGFVTGRDIHTLTEAGLFPNGTPKPPLLYATTARPAGSPKVEPAIFMLATARAAGHPQGRCHLDMGYTGIETEPILAAADSVGYQLAHDLKTHQRGIIDIHPKALFLDGQFWARSLPTRLIKIDKWARGASQSARLAVHAKFDERVPYAFQVHSRTETHIRFRGPCTFEPKLDFNGNLISYRKDRLTVRCPNHRLFDLMPRHLPKTTCQPGTTCYCSATFTIAIAHLPNSYEPLMWGTSNWAKIYYRRAMVETGNSQAQYHYRESRHTYRVLAPKWDLMRLMFAIGLNLAIIHTFMIRLRVPCDLTDDPDHTKAALAPIMIPPPPEPAPDPPPPPEPAQADTNAPGEATA